MKRSMHRRTFLKSGISGSLCILPVGGVLTNSLQNRRHKIQRHISETANEEFRRLAHEYGGEFGGSKAHERIQ